MTLRLKLKQILLAMMLLCATGTGHAITTMTPSGASGSVSTVLEVDSRRAAVRLETGWFRVDRSLFRDMRHALREGTDIRYEIRNRQKKMGGKGVISAIEVIK